MLLRPVLTLMAICLAAGACAAQEREWSLDASDQDAYLIFGVPDSEDVGVSLWCPVRQDIVNVFLPDVVDSPASGKNMLMTVVAGGQTAGFSGKTEENPEADGSSLEAQIPADHPILGAMRKADRFSVKVNGDERIFPLVEADIAGLIDLCSRN